MAWVETFVAVTSGLAALSNIAARIADSGASAKTEEAFAPLRREINQISQNVLALQQEHLALGARS